MKKIIALLVLVSANAYAYTPIYQVEVDSDNIVSLIVENDSDKNLECSYSLSWVENVLSYKKFYGRFSFGSGEVVAVNKKNDRYSRISRAKAHVTCE